MTAETELYSTPSLPDKAPGIYAALGPDELLRRMVYASGNASAAANSLAAAFANFLGRSDLYDVNRLRAETITNAANKLCRDAAELLACVDLILYAAEYGMGPCLPYGTRGGDLDNAYSNTLQNLLREAEQRGLSPDYTSAPMREARRRDCGLQRPAFTEEGGNKNT